MKKNFAYYKNNLLRVIEKVPGINLQQILRVDGKLYCITPKNGSRTLRDHFLEKHQLPLGDEWFFIEYHTKKSLIRVLDQERVYLIVRDPLQRLQSCWKQKLSSSRDSSRLPYFLFYYPWIRNNMSFEDFMRVVSKIPVWLCEKHFRPIEVTVPVRHPNLIAVPLSELSGLLRQKAVSNRTSKIPLTPNQHLFFDDKLRDRFEYEVQVEKQFGVAG